MSDLEKHYVNRSSWIRDAVLGANDGILMIVMVHTTVDVCKVGVDKRLVHYFTCRSCNCDVLLMDM